MTVSSLILGSLATWGLSALLYYWDGFNWLRTRAGVDMVDETGRPITFWGRQLHCFWCIAVWVSIPVSVLILTAPLLLYPPAFVGATIFLGQGGRIIWRAMTDG